MHDEGVYVFSTNLSTNEFCIEINTLERNNKRWKIHLI